MERGDETREKDVGKKETPEKYFMSGDGMKTGKKNFREKKRL